MQHKQRNYSLIYLTLLKIEKNKQKCYLNLRNMIKSFNLTTLDVATCMPLIIAMQLLMIENMCLVQSFPCRHNIVKSNNGCDNFRKKQDIIHLYVMSNNDYSSINNNNDTVSSSFPSLKKLENKDSIIIDNNTHDDGSNNNINNEGRSMNDHKNIISCVK